VHCCPAGTFLPFQGALTAAFISAKLGVAAAIITARMGAKIFMESTYTSEKTPLGCRNFIMISSRDSRFNGSHDAID
jgi:hypothetical protein